MADLTYDDLHIQLELMEARIQAFGLDDEDAGDERTDEYYQTIGINFDELLRFLKHVVQRKIEMEEEGQLGPVESREEDLVETALACFDIGYHIGRANA